MARIGCFVLAALLVSVFAVTLQPSGSVKPGVLAQEGECGNPAVVAWAAPPTGDLPSAETTILSIDGSPGRIAIDRPEHATSNSVPNRVLIEGQDGSLNIVDLSSSEIIPVHQPEKVGDEASAAVGAVRVPADSPWIPFNYKDDISLVNMETGEVVPVSARSSARFGLAPFSEQTLSPDEQWLVINFRGVLEIGPLRSSDPLEIVSKEERPWTTGFAFSPSSTLFAWAPSDISIGENALWLRDLQSGKESLLASGRPTSATTSLMFTDDSTLLWAQENMLEVYDLSTGTVRTFDLPTAYTQLWSHSPNGRQLLLFGSAPSTGSYNYFVFDLDTSGFTPVDGLTGMHPISPMSATEQLYFQSESSAAGFDWSLGPRVVAPIPVNAGFENADVSRTGSTTLFVGTGERAAEMQIIDLLSGTSAGYTAGEPPTVLSISPDGCYVGVGTFHVADQVRSAEITVLDLSGSVVQRFPGYVLAGWAPSSEQQ